MGIKNGLGVGYKLKPMKGLISVSTFFFLKGVITPFLNYLNFICLGILWVRFA